MLKIVIIFPFLANTFTEYLLKKFGLAGVTKKDSSLFGTTLWGALNP